MLCDHTNTATNFQFPDDIKEKGEEPFSTFKSQPEWSLATDEHDLTC